MKAHKAGALKTVLIAIGACVIGYVSFWALVLGPHLLKLRKEIRQRHTRLLCETDYKTLLDACRELSTRVKTGDLKSGHYNVRLEPDPESLRFPQAILDLEPTYIDIGRDGSVRVELYGGFGHFGVDAYPEDFGKPLSGHYGDRKLIEGLWYYDDAYYGNPDYDKTIDKIIERHRKKD